MSELKVNLLNPESVAMAVKLLSMLSVQDSVQTASVAAINTPPVADTFHPTQPVAPVAQPVAPVAQPVTPVAPVAPVAQPVASCPIVDPASLVKYVMESFQALGAAKGSGIQAILNELGYDHMNKVTPENYGIFFNKVEALKVA